MPKTTKLSEEAIVLFRRLDAMIENDGCWTYGEARAIEEIQKVMDKWRDKKCKKKQ